MNCRDFLNEFEDRNALSETATLHLNDCVDCRKINTVQTRVWQGIDGFKPVDAPKDFDFRVKARIANAKPGDFRQPLFPVLRYVMGLSIVGLILAFVVFNGFYSFDDKIVPQIAESNFQSPIQGENPSNKSSEPQQAFVADVPQPLEGEKLIVENLKPKIESDENKKQSQTSARKTVFVATNSTKKSQAKNTKDDEKNSGGSRVSASRKLQVITPIGILNSPQTIKNPSNFESANPITVEQILLQLGIEVALVNGKREVKKIIQNSVAERSGVKVGDFVEAIDGEKLTSEPIRAKIIEGKKLTVVRGREKVEIPLRY
jgi:membrane-associated protease RseP (regulator of RpoE activity)